MFKDITFSCLSGNLSWIKNASDGFKNAVTNIKFGGGATPNGLNCGDLLGYTNLKYLHLSSYSGLNTMADISSLTNLKEVFLYGFSNLDLNWLPLSNLTKLCVQNSNISSIYELEKAINLSYLDLKSNPLYDSSYDSDGNFYSTVEILKTLNSGNLKTLYLSNHKLTSTATDELNKLVWTDKSGF